jgi:spore coat protein U-like protein
MRRPRIILAVLTAGLGLGVPFAQATSPVTTSFQVRLQILDSCTVATPATLDFGQQTALGSAIDATTSISVTCSNTTPYNIALDAGAHGSSVTARKMQGGTSEQISYSLYRDSARTQNWGATVGTDTATGTGTGSAALHTVYGRVPSQSTPRPDTYTDTITVTVSY